MDPSLPKRVLAVDAKGKMLWDYEVRHPDMQEGGFGFWLKDCDGNGLDEVFVNEPEEVNILDGDGRLVDALPGHRYTSSISWATEGPRRRLMLPFTLAGR